MAKPGSQPGDVLSPAAERDIREALKWSEERFGRQAAVRYKALLMQALRGIAAEPQRPGSRERPELAQGVRSYHLSFSRDRARMALGIARNPRHFVVYRCREQKVVEIVRVLHDTRDLIRHLPGNCRRTEPGED